MGIKNKLLSWLTSDLQIKAKSNGILSNALDNNPIWSDWSTENAINAGMKASTYVYACVDRIMKAASSVPWNAYIKNSKGEWEEAHDHPLEQLIQKPNPFMSRKQLIEIVASHLYLGGNAVLQKVKARGTTVELWAISPDEIKPVPSKVDFISRYEYRKGTTSKDFKPDEIMHFMFTDPSNRYWGLSPLQAGAKVVDTDVEAVSWNKVALQNRAVADGVFTFKEPFINKEQWEEARQMVKEQHQGADNARAPWVLGNEATWTPMSLSPIEMDFLNSRKMTREEICSIFQVPPPMVGIYENATLANVETARKIFWVDTIIPFLDGLQEVFNRDIAPEFGDGVWIGYDISNVQALQENFGEKITNAQALFNMGVPFNKINERLELGFDSLEGGDDGYLPMNLVPTSYKPDKQNEIIEVIEEEEDSKLNNLLNSIETKLQLQSGEKKYFNLETTEQKEIHWKRMDDRRQKWEEQVARMIGKQFSKESKDVIKAFKDGDTSNAIKEIDKQSKNWKTLFEAFYTSVMADFGDVAGNSLIKSSNTNIETKFVFDPYKDGVRIWISKMVGKNIKNITDTTKEKIRKEIELGYEDGNDSQDIAERIESLYKNMGTVRALTIARTEIGSAMNAGSHFAVKQTGLKHKRKWLTSIDGRERDSHRNINGVSVNEDEPFKLNGGEMMFPGDSSLGASADEIVKCRCVEIYEVIR